MDHEKHQYFFERFLRNEMSDADKMTFEEKLSADPVLHKAFEHYKAHRARYLSDLLAVHREKAQHRQLNSWIYMLISLIGILISINFYLEHTVLKEKMAQSRKDSLPFYKRIPFLFSSPADVPSSQLPKSKPAAEPVVTQIQPDSIVQPEKEVVLAFDKDVLLHDTLIPVYKKEVFDQQYEFASEKRDSLKSDSLIEQLTLEHLDQAHREERKNTLAVEFWKSPIDYIGYKFNGKKLIIFGYDTPYKLTLIKQENQLMIRREEGNLYPVLNDNNFHKF
ncbi:MAG: hypothetical protein WC760_01745 [Bacteroidia bacterium]|jgi:hypothetical protein